MNQHVSRVSTSPAADTNVATAVGSGESEGSMRDAVTIELLNHASIILRHREISLLCDPWFDGTCFRGGWGLRYLNPAALAKTTDCTHLWISHFHSDHLHLPTLEQVAQRVPQIRALANVSLNFDMRGPLQRAGFTKVECLYERQSVSLSLTVARSRDTPPRVSITCSSFEWVG
jgi:ribonuclease BN (tRNA processing enzyme)